MKMKLRQGELKKKIYFRSINFIPTKTQHKPCYEKVFFDFIINFKHLFGGDFLWKRRKQ